MVTLGKDDNGNYRARKRIPNDLREEYGRLYGQRLEVKFHASADTKPHGARQQFNDWLSETEERSFD
jgi:hypothetical protein